MSLSKNCPLCDILAGEIHGTVVAQDDEKGFALIQSNQSESIVHWLAIPYEHTGSTEDFELHQGKRFLELFEYTIETVKQLREDEPLLYQGFSIKMHFGSYESIPHAKLHVLAME